MSEACENTFHAIYVDEIKKYRLGDSTVTGIHNWLNKPKNAVRKLTLHGETIW